MRYSTKCPTCKSTVRSWSGDDYARCRECDSDVFVPKVKPLIEDDSGTSFGLDRSEHSFGFEETPHSHTITTPESGTINDSTTDDDEPTPFFDAAKLFSLLGSDKIKIYQKAAKLAASGQRDESIQLFMSEFNMDREKAEQTVEHIRAQSAGLPGNPTVAASQKAGRRLFYTLGCGFGVLFFGLIAFFIAFFFLAAGG